MKLAKKKWKGKSDGVVARADSVRELHYCLHKKHCVERQRGINFPSEDISEIELHILKKKCVAPW